MKNNYTLDGNIIQALELANEICSSIGFIPRKVFLVSIYMVPNTPLQEKVFNSGYTPEQLSNNCYRTLRKICYKKIPKVYAFKISDKWYFNMENSIFKLFNWIMEHIGANEIISIDNILLAYKALYPKEFICTTCSILPEYAKNHKTVEKTDEFKIPFELSSFLTVMNTNYSKSDKICQINGRDEEINKLIRILMKNKKSNAVLIGAPGVGKTAIVEKLTWMIVTQNCPDFLKNRVVLSLDVNAIIAGTEFRGAAEKRFSCLINFLEKHPECILFIDEIHVIIGAGACREGELDFANALKPILARSSTKVIGATTNNEYLKFFSSDGALKRRFETITVNEPRSKDVAVMIKNQITALENHHGVKISKKIIDFVILNANCYNYETKNPDRTIDLIDKTLVVAKLNGKKVATKNDVLANFDYNRKLFKQMPIESKTTIAYHEAGHFIVRYFSKDSSVSNILSVSIMPTDNYLGVTVFETNYNMIINKNREFYVKEIAECLAGRIAEKMYTNDLTSGATKDLHTANKLASKVVLEFGLEDDFNKYRTFDYKKNKEKSSSIDKYIDKLLEDAWIYAEKILTEKKEYLEALVNALTKNGILSITEIEKIFSSVSKVTTHNN